MVVVLAVIEERNKSMFKGKYTVTEKRLFSLPLLTIVLLQLLRLDDCTFSIGNFPFVSSSNPAPEHGVSISQLSFSNVCAKYSDFRVRVQGLAVPVSYKTPTVLLIFKYGSSIGSDRGKKEIYV
jgi:hypothetical protein